jgi:murein L,D-transpeptidase YcbB/YkuD
MTKGTRGRFLAPSLALAALVGFGPGPAQAQNLFETLFGGGVRHRESREFPPPPAPRAAKPQPKPAAPIVKISAPSYYAYKADRLVKVPFAEILETPRPAAYEPGAAGGFDEALGGLEGFELLAEREIAAALTAYYADKRAFVWISGDGVAERAREALAVLGEAADHGLDPDEYAVALPGADATPAELARFEMALSARVMRYARDAYAGRIDPNRLSGYHDFPAKPLDLKKVLDRLAHTNDARAYLESRHPQNDAYAALRAELAALRASAEIDIIVDPRLLLKPGGASPELPKLLSLFLRETDDDYREQFGPVVEAHAQGENGEAYASDLVAAVKAAQGKKGLEADGVIGPRTVAAFAGQTKAARIAKVVVALEQLRWHPSDFGSPHVFINQPAFTASFVEGGEEKLSMRVVIGKNSNQTTFFHDEIDRVEYNPYWGVPQSIIVNEMLPRLRNDPGYLDRAGYEVTDSSGKRISSSSINWNQYGGRVPFNVRQTPSEANALGELKILFPNKHAIYMHDTPQKALFNRDSRAFSHGCVRLHDPRGMAAAVLGTTVDHVAEKIRRGHSSEKLEKKIPVYVAYFTAWPNAAGKVSYFTDVYGRDERVQKAFEVVAGVRSPAS